MSGCVAGKASLTALYCRSGWVDRRLGYVDACDRSTRFMKTLDVTPNAH